MHLLIISFYITLFTKIYSSYWLLKPHLHFIWSAKQLFLLDFFCLFVSYLSGLLLFIVNSLLVKLLWWVHENFACDVDEYAYLDPCTI